MNMSASEFLRGFSMGSHYDDHDSFRVFFLLPAGDTFNEAGPFDLDILHVA